MLIDCFSEDLFYEVCVSATNLFDFFSCACVTTFQFLFNTISYQRKFYEHCAAVILLVWTNAFFQFFLRFWFPSVPRSYLQYQCRECNKFKIIAMSIYLCSYNWKSLRTHCNPTLIWMFSQLHSSANNSNTRRALKKSRLKKFVLIFPFSIGDLIGMKCGLNFLCIEYWTRRKWKRAHRIYVLIREYTCTLYMYQYMWKRQILSHFCSLLLCTKQLDFAFILMWYLVFISICLSIERLIHSGTFSFVIFF